MTDGILWGYKQIADRLGCSVRSVSDKAQLPRDPLRLRRLGGKVWMTAARADAWRARHEKDRAMLSTVVGWRDIAKALRVPVRTAQRWASQPVDPLPVEKGRPSFAYRDALLDWVDGQAQRAVITAGPTRREDVIPPAPKAERAKPREAA